MVSLTLFKGLGPPIVAAICNEKPDQIWTWNATVETLQSKPQGQYLTVKPDLEIWAGPLKGGSQAVVLLNRADNGSAPITVHWTDIGFPIDHSATVRDLWARKDLGVFTGKYTSPNIVSHGVMMLNITLAK